ncbi:MAG: hypothetical protein AAFW47_02930 [Pseudomonadota bacterium]
MFINRLGSTTNSKPHFARRDGVKAKKNGLNSEDADASTDASDDSGLFQSQDHLSDEIEALAPKQAFEREPHSDLTARTALEKAENPLSSDTTNALLKE